MQGNNYVQAFNQRHERSGPLWQGRFHSSMVDSDAYLLSVYRYIERNPGSCRHDCCPGRSSVVQRARQPAAAR
jgi:hypothetical protein